MTYQYLDSLSKVVRVAYLDDLRAFSYPVDTIINYDVIPEASMESYQKDYSLAKHLLIGSQYTPLRKQFNNSVVSITFV